MSQISVLNQKGSVSETPKRLKTNSRAKTAENPVQANTSKMTNTCQLLSISQRDFNFLNNSMDYKLKTIKYAFSKPI